MSIPAIKDFSNYDQYSGEANATTDAEMQEYMGNQNSILEAMVDVGLWQPETNYSNGHVVFSPNMPNGTEAVCVATNGGKSSNTEPSWGEVGGDNVSDGTCFWKLRWKHWSKDVEQITDLTTGATNRLLNTSYAVSNVVYDRSNLSVALKCTTAGKTSNTELDVSGNNIGDTVTDGTVVWQVCNRTSDVTSVNGQTGDVNLVTIAPGFIQSYGGTTVPDGWLPCGGAAVSRTTYADLFAAIGTTYGSGNGSTTFNLPNMNNGSFAEGSDTAGTVKSAGLPNITGNITFEVEPCDGVFKQTGTVTGGAANNASYSSGIGNFDASRCSSIYGNSDTVQPKSVTVKFCIKY